MTEIQSLNQRTYYDIKLLSKTIDKNQLVTLPQWLSKFGEQFSYYEQSLSKTNLTHERNELKVLIEDLKQKLDQKDKEMKKMQEIVEEKEIEVERIQRKIENQYQKMEGMRFDYMKDISHLREYLFQKEIKNKDVEFIDIRFFEPSADIDPKT